MRSPINFWEVTRILPRFTLTSNQVNPVVEVCTLRMFLLI